MENNKKEVAGFLATFLAVAASVFLVVAGAILYWLYDQYANQKKAAQNQSQVIATITPEPTLIPLPTPTPDQTKILNEIIEALKIRDPRLDQQLQVFVNRQLAGYATGSYQTSEPFKSGWWLAALIDDRWQIIATDNGNILCDYLEGYEFPVSLVPECYDQSTGNLIDRATEVTVIVGVSESTQSAGP